MADERNIPGEEYEEIPTEELANYLRQRESKALAQAQSARNRTWLVAIVGFLCFAVLAGYLIRSNSTQIDQVVASLAPTAIAQSQQEPTQEPPASQASIDDLANRHEEARAELQQAHQALLTRQQLLEREISRIGAIVGEDGEAVVVEGEFECRYLVAEVANLGWGYVMAYYNRGSIGDFYYKVGEDYTPYQQGDLLREGAMLCRK